jgi:acyl-CoA reductase-like NAD-dependent aldehyde dehydrogenase
LLHQAGLPDGVLNVVTGTGRKAGAALVAHPGIDHVTFTGSVATGINVMQSAATNITRVVLELGGKSPLTVLADADLDSALDGVIGAIYENAGQICSAGSRLILEHPIAEAFLERLTRRAAQLTLGHGLDNKDVGPINSRQQLDKIDSHVMRARQAGNVIHSGGAIAHHADLAGGWFYQPTIIAARTPQDPLVQEEIFGPVLTVQIADDIDEAIALANCTEFALVAGIYTKDIGKAMRYARDVDAGQVYINEYFAGGIEVPFGGNRKSGFGREKGMEGIRSYCKLKSVVARI